MELNGVRLDTDALEVLDAKWRERTVVLRKEIGTRLGIANGASN